MLLLEIAETPDIAPLHQRQQMQGPHGLPVPVQVRQHEEAILRSVAFISENDVLLLRATLQDIKHPVQSALLALGAHVGSDMVAIDLRRLGDHAEDLIRVLLDVLVRAGPNEVEFEIGGSRPRRRGQVPPVDVVVAKVVDLRDGGVEGFQDLDGLSGKCGAFGDEDSGLRVNRAKEGDASAILVYSWVDCVSIRCFFTSADGLGYFVGAVN